MPSPSSLRPGLAALVLALVASSAARADLIAGWNYNGGTSGAAPSAANTAALFAVSHGTGTMSSTFAAANITNFTGTANNAQLGDPAGQALALQEGTTANPAANAGASLTWADSTVGYKSITVSFATQRTATGFDTDQFRYSLDGVTFTTFATFAPVISSATEAGGNFGFSTAAGLQTFNLSGIAGLANDPTASFQIVFNNSSAVTPSAAGNNRLDNLSVAGTLLAVPEPSSLALAATGLLGALALRRRTRAAH